MKKRYIVAIAIIVLVVIAIILFYPRPLHKPYVIIPDRDPLTNPIVQSNNERGFYDAPEALRAVGTMKYWNKYRVTFNTPNGEFDVAEYEEYPDDYGVQGNIMMMQDNGVYMIPKAHIGKMLKKLYKPARLKELRRYYTDLELFFGQYGDYFLSATNVGDFTDMWAPCAQPVTLSENAVALFRSVSGDALEPYVTDEIRVMHKHPNTAYVMQYLYGPDWEQYLKVTDLSKVDRSVVYFDDLLPGTHLHEDDEISSEESEELYQ